MATRKITFSVGEFYHLYNRGVDKRVIFLDKEDYEHFRYLLYLCNTNQKIHLSRLPVSFEKDEPIVAIGLYCLMPNHFHLLIKEIDEGGISKFMLKLTTAYAMYFNKKYARTGALFEGTFKSVHVTEDRQLKYLYSYIHLNPAKIIDKNWKKKSTKSKNELLEYTSKYPYSSIGEYTENKIWIISPGVFPKYFSSFIEHKKELWGWLSFSET